VRAAGGGTIALALLACACVFTALAGPAVSLRLRTEALQQELDRLGPLGRSIGISASWSIFTEAYRGQPVLSEDDFSGAVTDIAAGPSESVTLTAGSWGGLTTALHDVTAGTAHLPAGYQPKLEVIYRTRLARNVKTVTGHITAIPPDAIGVTVTEQTAAQYGLHTGSRLTLRGPGGPVALLDRGSAGLRPRPDPEPEHRPV
jgi:hypothetical protein